MLTAKEEKLLRFFMDCETATLPMLPFGIGSETLEALMARSLVELAPQRTGPHSMNARWRLRRDHGEEMG